MSIHFYPWISFSSASSITTLEYSREFSNTHTEPYGATTGESGGRIVWCSQKYRQSATRSSNFINLLKIPCQLSMEIDDGDLCKKYTRWKQGAGKILEFLLICSCIYLTAYFLNWIMNFIGIVLDFLCFLTLIRK